MRKHVETGIFVAGLVAVVVGISLMSASAAWIFGGAVLVALAVLSRKGMA